MKSFKKVLFFIPFIIFTILLFYLIALKSNLSNQKINEFSIEKNESKKEINNQEIYTIDLKGAVNNPGVYQVNSEYTVNDVIKLSGGLLENADTSIINLAKRVTNEMVIIIYTKEEVKNSNVVKTVIKEVDKKCVCPNIQNDGCLNNDIDEKIENTELVNINTADLLELQTINGIGEAKAKSIIEYREKNGNYTSIEDLENVDGIGEKLYEQIKIYITT